MPSDFEILRSIYNAFDPFEPLEAGDPVYVNCSAVRGEENILVDVGRQITYSDRRQTSMPLTCGMNFPSFRCP